MGASMIQQLPFMTYNGSGYLAHTFVLEEKVSNIETIGAAGISLDNYDNIVVVVVVVVVFVVDCVGIMEMLTIVDDVHN